MTVDLDKVRQKLQYIRSRVGELERFRSMDEREFLEDSFYPLAAARALQIALEASLDLCAHIIAHEGWGLPKSYREIVLIAREHGLIPPELVDTYLRMARFRNRLGVAGVRGVHASRTVSDSARDMVIFLPVGGAATVHAGPGLTPALTRHT